jgi:hypothetical protein
VKREAEWECTSLRWIHQVREGHYRATRALRLDAWLKPVDPAKAAAACRRMGLKVRVGRRGRRKRVRMAYYPAAKPGVA